MKTTGSTLSILALMILTVACGGPLAEETAPAVEAADVSGGAHEEHGIAWFGGSVEEAFAVAKAEGRPLFLYWGAEWCPPCHYLKNKIFKRPEFVAKSRQFVAVYLDGDTERAQVLGEELGVQGYPTVIVFSPGGEEVMRLPSTISVDEYADILDRALQVQVPVKEVLARVLESGPGEASSADLHLLAFYSWSQDSTVELNDREAFETFGTLYRDTPVTLTEEVSRFLTLYLEAAAVLQRLAETEGGAEMPPDIPASEWENLVEGLTIVLGERELRGANLSHVLYHATESVELLYPEPSAERDRLIDAWDGAAQELEADESLAVDDRLTALLPRIWLVPLRSDRAGRGEAPEAPEELQVEPQVELPAELVEHIRERIAWAGEVVESESELQAVMSTMAGLLQEAGLADEAEALLTERMSETVAPYYFMSWVAGLKKEAGETEEALAWYRKAYDAAKGRYTRFRWGSIYLRQVMTLAPEDAATVEAASREILGELLTFDDAFAGGNLSRLGQLEGAYQEWNEDGEHDAVLDALRDQVQAACERFPADGDDSQAERCRSFLTPEAD